MYFESYLGGKIEFKISSVCWAALESIAPPLLCLGGAGTGPVADGGVGLAFRALAYRKYLIYYSVYLNSYNWLNYINCHTLIRDKCVYHIIM